MKSRLLLTEDGRTGQRLLSGIVVLSLSTLLGCGGGGDGPTGPTAPTGGQIHFQQQVGIPPPDAVESNFLVVVNSVPAGFVEAVIDWEVPSQQISLFVTNPDCPGGLLNGVFHNDLCTVFAQADSGPKPRRAAFTNDRVRAFAMFISNYGPGAADVTLTIYVRQSPPTGTTTPDSVGTIRYLGSTLPEGSTVEVLPMHTFGQQAPNLRFSAVVSLRQGLDFAMVQAFVRTNEHRCMGGGGSATFPAGEDVPVMPLSMSHQSNPPPPCALPYTTTHVEFVVLDGGEVILSEQFPMLYHFVAAP